MKNYLVIITFLFALQNYAQSDVKKKFQKNRYDLAVSHYKKLEYTKAIDLFFVASKIDPESPIGLESRQKVDTLKTILRKELVNHLQGTWRKTGNEPSWTTKEKSKISSTEKDELIVINDKQILFYEQNIKTKERKLVKSENFVFYDKEDLNGVFSGIILSDKTIWTYSVDDTAKTLQMLCVGEETQEGTKKIIVDNPEIYCEKVLYP
ncbi:hypothetical protein SGQ44_13195 [Flavobacterium sp. Fl-77]|uniref:Uncharacterized protein n=1 Tax=Flavobacterium flavipigmentatum TaxID=2893884 RepID=A0AAJ2VXZ7_9FLAO|nr:MULTISPECIES: hypothetical protein [unclassified Flavobacterium]MDX6183434.1 hypothetical protein [Flavobacterium sp. Fl-33]MDX6186718.1 hypothetical protein [Flavobacterium sp. Fl-77]UFH38514.1 hypothetical protein LNP22_17530 [Flavobacterium sp. F-70]